MPAVLTLRLESQHVLSANPCDLNRTDVRTQDCLSLHASVEPCQLFSLRRGLAALEWVLS